MASLIAFVITCISVLTNVFIVTLGLFILFKFAISERRAWNTTFVTAVYFYISLLFLGCVLLSTSLTSFFSDIGYYIYTDSIGCRVLGHLLILSLSFTVNAFPLEAFVRCCTVVYRQNAWLRTMKAMTIYMAISLAYSFVSFGIGIPLYNVRYEPTEFTCSIDFLSWKGIVYSMVVVSMSPLTLLIIIYRIVVNHMRRSTQAVQNYQQRSTHRDVRVLTRIVILTFVASLIGIPSVTICIVGIITGQVYDFTYRIEITSVSLWVVAIEIGLIFINPQIKPLVTFRSRRGQIEPNPAINRGQ